MKITYWRFRKRLGVLAFIASLTSLPVWGDEEKTETESKDSSSRAQVEIRVQSGKEEGKPVSEVNQENVTVVVDVSGDRSDAVKDESDRKVQTQNRRFDLRLPFDRSNQDFPSAMVQAFSSSNTMSPAQKEKLRNGIREALVESGVESEVVDKALKRVDKTLGEIGSQASFSWRGSGKLPYRVGIGCKLNEPDDSSPGLEVETVFEDSPAAHVGLKPGDRLIAIDKQPIQTHEDIVSAVQRAGEENRTVQLEAKRGDVSTVYEMKPQQTAVAELHTELFQPGRNPFSGQAWVIPQWPQESRIPFNDPKLQERIRDAVKEAVEAARGAANMGASEGSRKDGASSEVRNEKNIDELRRELSDVHKDLEEIKDALKKLSDKP